MKLITIDISKEPVCLIELRKRSLPYHELKDECLKSVRKLLFEFQFGYCAYCEKRLSALAFIEHYIPISRDSSKQLNFDNFLGVCSGKDYWAPPANDHISHCGDKRQSITLKINPKSLEDIKTIYFESDATVRSNNSDYDKDLTVVLNLNFERLKEKRIASFNHNYRKVIGEAMTLRISKIEAYKRALELAESGMLEYSAFIVFQYKKLIQELNNN